MSRPRNPLNARPKRPAEEALLTHLTSASASSNGPSSKKPRFDARNPSTLAANSSEPQEEEDSILDLDEIGKGGQTKRNAVNLEGFESDSSNENFDARAAEKARLAKQEGRAAKSKDEEEADMFADLEDDFADGDQDEDLTREGKKSKEVRFIDSTDIMGQESTSKGGGHVAFDPSLRTGQATKDVESSSDSGDDEQRATLGNDYDEELGAGHKKKHAPKLDAFNMRSEGEEGRFDESGNFVRNAVDPDAVHDSWLEGTTKRDIKKAREAHEKREEERRARDRADDMLRTSDILSTLIRHMERGETVLEALQRLGKSKAKPGKKKPWQKNKRKDGDAMDIESNAATAEDEAEKRRKDAVEALTGAADQLLTRGETEIYEQERELLVRQYKRETGEEWVEPARPEVDVEVAGGEEAGERKMWKYKWSDARDGGEVHGPYDGRTMLAWDGAGYFGEGVEFRRAGVEEGEWSRTVEFV